MAGAWLYVLPLHGEDWLKVGVSNDPLRRAREFARRWYNVFDLDRAMLVETERMPDARALERDIRARFAEHRAPMPLHIADAAGGATEWYRGAHAGLAAYVEQQRVAGHSVHVPARPWFASALAPEMPHLHDWVQAVLRDAACDGEDALGLHLRLPQAHVAMLRDALDAFSACGLDPSPHLPDAVAAWHAACAQGRSPSGRDG